MRIFKNIAVFVFVLGAFAFSGYSFYLYSLRPCDKPLRYKIGGFDEGFGISKEDFKINLVEAELVWEKVLSKDLFVYDQDAEFSVNLIYDERQLSTVQKQRVESGLQAAEDVLNKLDAEFNRMKTDYDKWLAVHNQLSADFESRQREYKIRVDYWNANGGAPKKEYESLQNELRGLNREAEILNTETSALNAAAKELNALLQQRNGAALEYNKTADSYNKNFGHGLEFNQAEYTGREINVYQFKNSKDLRIALAHEFGHVLGMDHVSNSKSVMYYLTGDNAQTNLSPSLEDIAELNRVCKM